MKTETKPTHTPGPWRIGDAGHTIFGPNVGNISPVTIATIPHRPYAHENPVNVRLIAAAPELLDQLKAAVDLLKTMIVDETEASLVIHHVRQYEACIAKAESL